MRHAQVRGAWQNRTVHSVCRALHCGTTGSCLLSASDVRSTFLSNAKNFQDLNCREKVVQPYSRFSRKLDHELVDCTKKHQFPLQTSINNNKPFASTAGSWFPTFSLKQISSIEVSLICSICHMSHILPMFSHVFLPWLRRKPRHGEMQWSASARKRGSSWPPWLRHEEHFVWAATVAAFCCEIHPMVRKNYHFFGDGV